MKPEIASLYPVAKARHGADHFTVGNGPPFPVVAKCVEDAELIAGALYMRSQCGLTPVELLDQRDSLFAALVELRYACTDKAEKMADAAIEKSKGVAP